MAEKPPPPSPPHHLFVFLSKVVAYHACPRRTIMEIRDEDDD
jgi:hypothetical protein